MTRLAVVVVGLVMFAALGALLWFLTRRFERAGQRAVAVRPDARWSVAERSLDGSSTVVVERVDARPQYAAQVLETREVGTVEAGDPAYDARLADLRLLARDRARLLNQQERNR